MWSAWYDLTSRQRAEDANILEAHLRVHFADRKLVPPCDCVEDFLPLDFVLEKSRSEFGRLELLARLRTLVETEKKKRLEPLYKIIKMRRSAEVKPSASLPRERGETGKGLSLRLAEWSRNSSSLARDLTEAASFLQSGPGVVSARAGFSLATILEPAVMLGRIVLGEPDGRARSLQAWFAALDKWSESDGGRSLARDLEVQILYHLVGILTARRLLPDSVTPKDAYLLPFLVGLSGGVARRADCGDPVAKWCETLRTRFAQKDHSPAQMFWLGALSCRGTCWKQQGEQFGRRFWEKCRETDPGDFVIRDYRTRLAMLHGIGWDAWLTVSPHLTAIFCRS